MSTEITVVADGVNSTATTLQPIGSTYMADLKLLSDAKELYEKQERSFCPCKQRYCPGLITYMRRDFLVPPTTIGPLLYLIPTLAFGPLEECLGCYCLQCLGCYCLPYQQEDIEIPKESLKENAVSFFTTEGVVADTYYKCGQGNRPGQTGLNCHDPAPKHLTDPMTMLWPNILHVDVQKSREVPRACGTCSIKNDYTAVAPKDTFSHFSDDGGLSFYCDVRMGILLPCCSIMCVEEVVPLYSEVTFFISPKGLDGMQALMNKYPRMQLQKRCDKLAKEDKTLLVGRDISKITIRGLKDVDQYISDLQRVSAQHRGGHPLSISLNKKTIVYNPDLPREKYSDFVSIGDEMGGCGE